MYQQLQELLIKALVKCYSDDGSAPSIITSWLAARGVFYVSLVRYDGKYGRGKRVVLNCTSGDLTVVLRDIACQWLTTIENVVDTEPEYRALRSFMTDAPLARLELLSKEIR